MKIKICLFSILFFTFQDFKLIAQDEVSNPAKEEDGKVVYKYKQYEKFDFDELSVSGEGGAPGDLSVTPRYTKEFTNKLPLRENFIPEIRRSLERVQ
jgi:hypothetical protein